MALTATNVAKAAHWISIPKKERGAFSMADIKTVNHNALLMDRFFSTFGVNPHLKKNQKHVKELLLYGRSEEHTSELQSLMRISYAVFCLKKKKNKIKKYIKYTHTN